MEFLAALDKPWGTGVMRSTSSNTPRWMAPSWLAADVRTGGACPGSARWTPPDRRAREPDLIALIRAATGVTDLDVTIERLSSFAVSAQIAERYRRGRCFLIGDAAHRMTPRGGTGMNTGIQDGFDLGWKLAWVLHGWAPAELLDTYDDERRPIGLHNVGRAASAGGARRTTDEALPWDLDDRLVHCWLDRDGDEVSTLDLIGDGSTLFAATDDPRWADVAGRSAFTAPVEVIVIEGHAGMALGLGRTGAVLVRPDGHEVARLAHGSMASPDPESPGSQEGARVNPDRSG